VFRHVVLFRWKPGTDPAALTALERALAELPGQVPEIESYRFGRDASLTAGNFDFAIVAEFADEAAWRRYVDHPAHQKLVAERVRPIVLERAAAQVRTDSP
jgi:Stress responsive A/B Barrel Domain